MKKQKANKGITLIALIITIVVLLILAVVSINLVVNSGIIVKTQDATNKYKIEEEKEKVGLGYADYKMAKLNDENATLKVDETEVKGNEKDGWIVTFTKTGNTYVLKTDGNVEKQKKWEDYGLSEANIGDYVNYDELAKGVQSTTVDYTKNGGDTSDKTQTFQTQDFGWRILGINDYGQLELISDNPSTDKVYLWGEIGWLNMEDILNNDICNKLYGQGNKAIRARSLRIEDINKLANYDPTTSPSYGTEWIYKYSAESESLQYSSDGGTTWKDSSKGENGIRLAGKTEKIGFDNYGEIKVTNINKYRYNFKTLIENTDIANMIIMGTGTEPIQQWLATREIRTWWNYIAYCAGRTMNGQIGNNYTLYNAIGEINYGMGLPSYRPVVTLDSSVTLTPNTEGWEIH